MAVLKLPFTTAFCNFRGHWRQLDRRYGVWWRLANGLAAALILATLVIPLLQQLTASGTYRLSSAAAKLVGRTDARLAAQLSYDAPGHAYRFNKTGLAASGNKPVDPRLQTGIASGKDADKSLYALDIPENFSKGITYHDTNTRLSFALLPQFKAKGVRQVDGHPVYQLEDGGEAIYTLKHNGLKEDIVFESAPRDSLTFDYKLALPDTLEARMLPDDSGGIGIYAANPALYANMNYGTTTDKTAIDQVRRQSQKTELVFALPAPIIKDVDDQTVAKTWFELRGDRLTVVAQGLTKIKSAFSIDPSVVITSTTDFQTAGNNEGNIDFSVSGQISRAAPASGTTATYGTTSPLVTDRRNFATASTTKYMYVLGGIYGDGSSTYTSAVMYAPINSDGTVGAWHYTHNNTDDGSTFVAGFSGNRTYAQAQIYNDYLYVFGGFNGSTGYSDVQYAPINANGTIGTWQTASAMTTTRNGHASAVYNGYLYAYGGCTTYNLSNCNSIDATVERAAIRADGSLGAWTTTGNTSFTTARQLFGGGAYNGFIYAIGGCTGLDSLSKQCNTFSNNVEYAPLNADGTVGSWQTAASTFTTARAVYGSAIANGYVYISGGTTSLNDVQYAPIYANGAPGVYSSGAAASWNTTSSFATARYQHGMIAANGYLYIMGGCSSNVTNCGSGGAQADVQYAKVDIASGAAAFSGEGAINAWTNGNTYINGIYGGGSIAYNGYVYLIGGYDNIRGVASNAVQYAPINANGSSGAWHYTYNGADTGTTFTGGFNNGGRLRGTTLLYNGYLYVLGGCTAVAGGNCTAYSSDVQYAPINANGTIGTWATAGNFMTARWDLGAATYNGSIYMTGGSDASTKYNDVQYATVNADGSLSSWRYTHSGIDDGTTFVAGFTGGGRQALTSFAYNGYLYVVGGLSGAGLQNSILYAPINANGTIGTWATAGTFTTARYLHSSVAYNGYLYILGGFTNAFQATTQYAPINANGTIGTFTASSSFANARGYAAVSAYNGVIYLLGGSNNSNTYNTVQYSLLLTLPRSARYSKLLNLDSTNNFTRLSYNGSLAGGSSAVSWRKADATAVLGANTVVPADGRIGQIGCIGSGVNSRYLLLSFRLDDTYGGSTAGGSGITNSLGRSVITDFTAQYYPPHPTNQTRLRHGQTLIAGDLTALDTCNP